MLLRRERELGQTHHASPVRLPLRLPESTKQMPLQPLQLLENLTLLLPLPCRCRDLNTTR
jgi:hypothetical protein